MQIKMNMPNRPKGDPIEVPGLGLFPNGETTPVDPARLEEARAAGIIADDVPDTLEFGEPGAELPPPPLESPVEAPAASAPPAAPLENPADGGGN